MYFFEADDFVNLHVVIYVIEPIVEAILQQAPEDGVLIGLEILRPDFGLKIIEHQKLSVGEETDRKRVLVYFPSLVGLDRL